MDSSGVDCCAWMGHLVVLTGQCRSSMVHVEGLQRPPSAAISVHLGQEIRQPSRRVDDFCAIRPTRRTMIRTIQKCDVLGLLMSLFSVRCSRMSRCTRRVQQRGIVVHCKDSAMAVHVWHSSHDNYRIKMYRDTRATVDRCRGILALITEKNGSYNQRADLATVCQEHVSLCNFVDGIG